MISTLDTSLATISAQVNSAELANSPEQILETRECLIFMQGQIKQLKEQIDKSLTAWIEQNGSISIGSRRIFLSKKKDTKCRDLRPALEALMNEVGGDWEKFCNCMSVNAIKHGAAKIIMSKEVWDRHFEVIQKNELELTDVDEHFLKGK